MDKAVKIALMVLVISLAIFGIFIFSSNSDKRLIQNTQQPGTPIPTPTASPSPEPSVTPEISPVISEPPTVSPNPDDTGLAIRTDYSNFQPNESGEIPIVMFHRFLEAYEPSTEKDYTSTFAEFETLLQTLYDMGFRLISMKDFIDCNINVPAGTMPMVFTFDDGTPSQFNLIEEDGGYRVNPRSAVGILMDFNEKHPDFGLKGIFYVNMDIGDNTFAGAGELKDRFEYLQSLGFEIGSHTWGHVDYKKLTSSDAIIESLGKNQEKALSIMPDLYFYSLALPFGSLPKDSSLKPYLVEGQYNGISYKNLSIMAVGANPSVPSISKDYNSEYVRRIRAQGRVAVDADLTWWLPKMTSSRMFISDGDPNTIVVPGSKKEKIDEQKLDGKTLITY